MRGETRATNWRFVLTLIISLVLTSSAIAKILSRNFWPFELLSISSVARFIVTLIELVVAATLVTPRYRHTTALALYWGFIGAAATSVVLLPWTPSDFSCGCLGSARLPTGVTVFIQGLILILVTVLLRLESSAASRGSRG